MEGEVEDKLCCFTMYFRHDFLSPRTTIVLHIENYTVSLSAYLVALMIWHSCYHALTLKSGVRKYISPRINFCL